MDCWKDKWKYHSMDGSLNEWMEGWIRLDDGFMVGGWEL